MDYNTFANNIKQKYPQYKDEDNLELSKKIVDKYPQYKNQVQLPKDDYFSRVGERFKSAGQDIQSGIKAGQDIKTSGVQDIQQGGFFNTLKGLAKQKIGDVKSKLAMGGGVARGLSSTVEEAPVVKQVLDKTGEIIAPAVQSGLETDTGKKILELQQKYPEAFKSLQDVVDIASLIPVSAGAKVGVKGTELATKGALKATKEIPSLIKKAPNAVLDTLATENPIKLAKIKTGVAKNLNEYADEFSRSRNAISGATNKIDGYNYGTHVAEKNLLPDVTDSGRFDGRDIIKGVQDEQGQLKTFLNTKLDDSVRNTNLDEFKTGLMEDITKKGGIADAESMRSYVDRYVNEIRNRYGDNLSDKVLYAIKSDADAGYNYLSPNADINASKIIADRARQSIRSSDPEIAKALDEMTKNYETIRITQSLEPYKVKAGNLTTRLAQLGGSLLGANSVEGGLLQKTLAATLGGLAGQKLVKALQQSAFISPVARKAIEKELMKKVKPEAVKTILKKLDNGVDLSEVETKVLERAGNQLKNSSIITNDKMTANTTDIPKSIPPNKKSSQAGFISTGGKDLQPLYKEAQGKSMEEFVKSKGNPERWTQEYVKIPTDKIYRGVGEHTGDGGAMYGNGLYTTTNKTIASRYGKVSKLTEESLPKNPIQFRNENEFNQWEYEIAKRLGKTGRRDLYSSTDVGVDDLVKSLGYDGLTYGSGNNMVIVKYNKTPSKMDISYNDKSQLEQIWKEANAKTSTKQGMTVINPLTAIAGSSAIGAGVISIKNKKK